MSDDKLAEIKRNLESMFYWMDELGYTLHPTWVNNIVRIAEIVGIDISTVPTEGRALLGKSSSTDRQE